MTPNRVGQRFGEYRLVRFLGQGTFGDVYLGEHVRDKTLTAVKVLKTHPRDDTDPKRLVAQLKEFINEASIFNLKHPHIAQLLAFGVGKDDTPFLVFDYAPNGSLRSRHPRGTSLPLAMIVTYVQQIAAALQYAHDHKRIHRDVKLENILLGPNDEILLSDFGIATFAHDTDTWEEQKRTGTLVYMAPEQIQRKARPASDQYALGVMVYEWLCSMPPFIGDEVRLMYQHLEVLPPPFKRDLKIPPEVEQVVMTALAKDPKQRFASVQAFATALEQASQTGQRTYETFVAAHGAMFGFDAAHTRSNPYEQVLSPATVPGLTQAWTYPDPAVGHIRTSPAVANGVVYVGSDDHSLYALDVQTGHKLWSFVTGDFIGSSPAVAGGVVYVGSFDRSLYALDVQTGHKLWSFATGNSISSSPAVANGVVYIGSYDHSVYALDARIGSKLWSFAAGNSISSSPAVANGVVYVGSDDTSLYALDARTGSKLWSFPTGSPIYSSPAVAGGVVYVGSQDHWLYALDARTGHKLWSFPTENSIDSDPAIANGVVYIGSDDGRLYAFHLK